MGDFTDPKQKCSKSQVVEQTFRFFFFVGASATKSCENSRIYIRNYFCLLDLKFLKNIGMFNKVCIIFLTIMPLFNVVFYCSSNPDQEYIFIRFLIIFPHSLFQSFDLFSSFFSIPSYFSSISPLPFISFPPLEGRTFTTEDYLEPTSFEKWGNGSKRVKKMPIYPDPQHC